jgi:hypothetical protein
MNLEKWAEVGTLKLSGKERIWVRMIPPVRREEDCFYLLYWNKEREGNVCFSSRKQFIINDEVA